MARLAHSVSLALCKQGNTLDIALDTFQSLVSISEVRECVTQTLQILQISRDLQTRVYGNFLNWWSLLIGGAALRWVCFDFLVYLKSLFFKVKVLNPV